MTKQANDNKIRKNNIINDFTKKNIFEYLFSNNSILNYKLIFYWLPPLIFSLTIFFIIFITHSESEYFISFIAGITMFFIYFVLPMWGIYFDALTAGVIAIGCNLGAYGSEVVRGGVLAVGKEQHEASLALNYSPYKRYRHVIIPQAIPVMIPTFGNLQIELLKLTAVASLITISDLTFMAHIIRVQTALTLEPFLVILVIYLS